MPEYRVGDVVKITSTARVEEVDLDDSSLCVTDVQSGARLYVFPTDVRVEMVKRAPDMHEGPRPDAGKVIRGKDLKRIWWKRGTIVRCVGDDRGLPVLRDVDNALVLRGDGKWYVLSNDHQSYNDSYEFDELAGDGRFQLVHVA